MSPEQPEDQYIRRMADLLCQGSTLTELACPACASPLFKLRNGDLWCGRCEKKVIQVKEGEEQAKLAGSMALESLEATLLTKIQEVQNRIQHVQDVDELLKLNTALSGLLENLERLRKTKKS